VEGQIHGGVVQGIGWALLEGMTYDEGGQLLTSTLMDYALPHSLDAPCAGYLGYPFQNQVVNSHAGNPKSPI